MGFYFNDGDDLYGVTARHVLFPADEDNSDYTYNPSRPRKEVLLMGTKAWNHYLVQIQIGTLGTAVEVHKESIRRLEGRAEGDTPAAEKVTKELKKTRELLEETTGAINELQELYKQTKKDFSKPSQRVINHVVWSPAITVGTAQHDFTKDVRVVKLDKARFLPNFKGNVIDLGAC
jgi:chromosome segregation ATPase